MTQREAQLWLWFGGQSRMGKPSGGIRGRNCTRVTGLEKNDKMKKPVVSVSYRCGYKVRRGSGLKQQKFIILTVLKVRRLRWV